MSAENTESCPFCAVLEGRSRERYDTVLAEASSFIVLPALGALQVGHVIAVTRQHTPNLLGSGDAVLQDYDALLASIRGREPYRDSLLEAEHGASKNRRAGACIDHTHVNLIPNLGSLAGLVCNALPLIHTAARL